MVAWIDFHFDSQRVGGVSWHIFAFNTFENMYICSTLNVYGVINGFWEQWYHLRRDVNDTADSGRNSVVAENSAKPLTQ